MALAMLLVIVAAGAQEFPAHVGKVNDFANVLSAAQRDQLESELAGPERDTSAEVAVVTAPSPHVFSNVTSLTKSSSEIRK